MEQRISHRGKSTVDIKSSSYSVGVWIRSQSELGEEKDVNPSLSKSHWSQHQLVSDAKEWAPLPSPIRSIPSLKIFQDPVSTETGKT